MIRRADKLRRNVWPAGRTQDDIEVIINRPFDRGL
jgi:hypothetical protein